MSTRTTTFLALGSTIWALGGCNILDQLKQESAPAEAAPVPPEPAPAAPSAAGSWRVGDAVDVEWKGTWYKALILTTEPGDQYKIHYVGWSSNWDEVVPASRIRARTDQANVGSEVPAEVAALPATPPPQPAALAGRSPVPTQAEWSGVPEVTVRGSSALNCETKAVREWLRVSCRGEDASRGRPTAVSVVRGTNRGEIFTFASGGVSSLVMPFVEGTDVEALFSWDRAQHRFVSQWPRGAPRPTAYGTFQGASPAPTIEAPSCRTVNDCAAGTQCCDLPFGPRCVDNCYGQAFTTVCRTTAECPQETVWGAMECGASNHTPGVRACQQVKAAPEPAQPSQPSQPSRRPRRR